MLFNMNNTDYSECRFKDIAWSYWEKNDREKILF